MNSKSSVSIVVPSRDEEENLEKAVNDLLSSLREGGIDSFEIIIINDGSSDQTGAIAERLSKDEKIRVIHHSRPLGVGASLNEGYALAGGEYVTWFPGDGENPAKEVVKCLSRAEGHDIIVPYIANRKARGLKRRVISRLFTLAVNLTFKRKMRYYNGLTIYRREVFTGIKVNSGGFFFHAEALIKALRLTNNFLEVPTLLGGRQKGSSKALKLKAGKEVLSSYFALIKEMYRAPKKNSYHQAGTHRDNRE